MGKGKTWTPEEVKRIKDSILPLIPIAVKQLMFATIDLLKDGSANQ